MKRTLTLAIFLLAAALSPQTASSEWEDECVWSCKDGIYSYRFKECVLLSYLYNCSVCTLSCPGAKCESWEHWCCGLPGNPPCEPIP